MPIRSFGGALSRLAGVLDASQRAALMQSMAARVVAAATPYPVYVVSDDSDVRAWAASRGAAAMTVGRPGLSVAAQVALERLEARGFEQVAVAHADLALVRTLTPAVGPGVTIVPDQRRDGSNVVCVPAASGFRFAYGPGSFGRHLAEAARLGLPVTVVDDPLLATDIDHPDDLRALPDAELAALGLSEAIARLRRSPVCG